MASSSKELEQFIKELERKEGDLSNQYKKLGNDWKGAAYSSAGLKHKELKQAITKAKEAYRDFNSYLSEAQTKEAEINRKLSNR